MFNKKLKERIKALENKLGFIYDEEEGYHGTTTYGKIPEFQKSIDTINVKLEIIEN